jgi:hypothetical protein
LTSELKVGEWYSSGSTSLDFYSSPYEEMKENPYKNGNFKVLEDDTPFLILSMKKISEKDTLVDSDFVFDVKILVNGNVAWLTINQDAINKLADTWITTK